MKRRILSDKQRRWLLGELGDWRGEGIVSQEQTDRILARYENTDESSQRKRSRFTLAISGIAALLVGLAVFLVIGYNWDAMPRVAKLAVVFGVVAATHAVGLWLRFARDARRAGEVVSFLGCLFYGAGIWLVAQVFHLNAHWPDGFWWWALGVLPFALASETLLIHCLYAGLLATWIHTEFFSFRHIDLVLYGGWTLPNGAYSLLLLALPGLWWAYRHRSMGAVALYIPVVAWWIGCQPLAWGMDRETVYVSGAVSAMLLIIAESHRRGDRLAAPYWFWGAWGVASALVPLGFEGFYRMVARLSTHHVPPTQAMVVFAPAIAIVLLLSATVVLARLLKPEMPRGARDPARWLCELLRAQWLPVGLALAMGFMVVWSATHDFGNADNNDWVLPTVIANVAILAFALRLMAVGLRDDRGWLFGFGVVYFLIWAVCRYVDLFSKDGGMLGAALMFFLCGAALFGLARFWSRRKASRSLEKTETAGDGASVPSTGPAWLDGVAQWFAARERGLLPALAAAQVAVLAGMIALHAAPLMFGETIRLKVQPVDPRDLMRGDYVILSYAISNVPDKGIEGIPDANNRVWHYWERESWLEGRTVYVTLEPDAGGKLWRGVKTSVHKPASGKFIRGKYVRQWGTPQVQFGIEAFYVQEGAGKKLEEARNARHLVAEVALLSSGKAALRDLIVE